MEGVFHQKATLSSSNITAQGNIFSKVAGGNIKKHNTLAHITLTFKKLYQQYNLNSYLNVAIVLSDLALTWNLFFSFFLRETAAKTDLSHTDIANMAKVVPTLKAILRAEPCFRLEPDRLNWPFFNSQHQLVLFGLAAPLSLPMCCGGQPLYVWRSPPLTAFEPLVVCAADSCGYLSALFFAF